MTGRTVRAKLAVVTIILFMAGITIRRCALEDIIDMALFALDTGMFTFKFECGEIMIELRRLPGLCCVA